MPRYKCHKIVSALKIRLVKPHMQSGKCTDCILAFEPHDDQTFPNKTVHGSYFDAHKPTAGGYFVLYEDGYQSFSPAKAFESGYSLIVGEESDSIDVEEFAGILYEDYCERVGGIAWNNDPLPSWAEFRADPEKKKQSDAWVGVAMTALGVPESVDVAQETTVTAETGGELTEEPETPSEPEVETAPAAETPQDPTSDSEEAPDQPKA